MSSYTCAHVRARTHTHTHVLMTHDMYSMPGTYVLAITGILVITGIHSKQSPLNMCVQRASDWFVSTAGSELPGMWLSM